MYYSNIRLKGLLLLLIIGLILLSCKKDDSAEAVFPVDHARGEIVKMTSMGLFSTADVQQLLDNSGTTFDFHLSHSVEAFSVQYYTVNHKDELILVSGALILPQDRASLGMISMQHGTISRKDHVASVSPENSTEGIIGMLTASMGYITLIPDYPGFGTSNLKHPYLHAKSIVPSVIDFILAAEEYCMENNYVSMKKLFLTGYSEGGYVSLMTQKVIEESYSDEINLTAVAPLSGPYDLHNTFDKIFEDNNFSTPAYVAYVLTAYNNIYNWNSLGSFFQAPYASMMNELFDGSKSWEQVIDALPETLSELMHPDFNSNFVDTEESIVRTALMENTLLDWIPEAPIHFFHGDCDDIVFCLNATNAMEAFLANGANDIQLTILEGKDHETAGPFAITGSIQWIEDFHPDL